MKQNPQQGGGAGGAGGTAGVLPYPICFWFYIHETFTVGAGAAPRWHSEGQYNSPSVYNIRYNNRSIRTRLTRFKNLATAGGYSSKVSRS